jgi:hypothetical protein
VGEQNHGNEVCSSCWGNDTCGHDPDCNRSKPKPQSDTARIAELEEQLGESQAASRRHERRARQYENENEQLTAELAQLRANSMRAAVSALRRLADEAPLDPTGGGWARYWANWLEQQFASQAQPDPDREARRRLGEWLLKQGDKVRYHGFSLERTDDGPLLRCCILTEESAYGIRDWSGSAADKWAACLVALDAAEAASQAPQADTEGG